MLANRAITHTLASRFQLEQNIQITAILEPSAILEFLTFLPNQIFLFLVIGGLNLSYETKTVLIHCNYFWKICFCMAYPIVAFARNVHLRRGLVKAMPWKSLGQRMATRTKVVRITPKGLKTRAQAKVHFDTLDKMWMKP